MNSQSSGHLKDGSVCGPPAGRASAAILLSTAATCRSPSRSTLHATRSSCRIFCSTLILSLPPHRTVKTQSSPLDPCLFNTSHNTPEGRNCFRFRSPNQLDTGPVAEPIVGPIARPIMGPIPWLITGPKTKSGMAPTGGTRAPARSCPVWHPCARHCARPPLRSRRRPGSPPKPGGDLRTWPGR